MESIGNRKSQKIYEAALPDSFMRPQTNYAVEEFIRAKYQYKRYCIQSESAATVTSLETTEASLPKMKDQESEKNLVSFDIGKDKETCNLSDDSLSDPEYVVKPKPLPKACHKVLSESDLISFHPGNDRLLET